MDEQMQQVETTMGLAAKKCNSVLVEKIYSNSTSLETEYRAESKLCLYNWQDRLTNSTQKPTRMPSLLSWQSSNSDLESQKLVENMSAFSLATSSAPTDVLRHFLHVRLEAIRSSPEALQHMRSSMLRAIKLFKGTLADAQTIFPRRLADSLSRLKMQPLMRDKDILSLPALNLELHGRWIADEVRNFTPWPRHDELQKSEAQKQLRLWAPTALKALTSAAHAMLLQQDDFAAVMKLREDVLEVHLSNNSRILGVESSDVLDSIRDSFNDRLRTLLKRRADGLATLCRIIASVIGRLPSDTEPQGSSLWSLADTPPLLEGGATAFKDAIRDRFYGHDEAARACLSNANQWITNIKDMRALIRSMKERRWEDDILDANSETYDDFDLDSRQTLLSEDDPRALNDALDAAFQQALTNFSRDFKTITASTVSSSTMSVSVFLLRVLRHFLQSVTELDDASPPEDGRTRSGFDAHALFTPLYDSISSLVAQASLKAFQQSLSRFVKRPFHASMLWEGHPPLPVQSSPSAFKLLFTLARSMAAEGQDLWAPAIVETLKAHVNLEARNMLAECYSNIQSVPEQGAIAASGAPQLNGSVEEGRDVKDGSEAGNGEAIVNGTNNNEASKDPIEVASSNGTNAESFPHASQDSMECSSVAKTEKLTQLLFDGLYIQRVLHVTKAKAPGNGQPMQSLLDDMCKDLELESEQLERMRKSVSEYWRRTYLLLGLLC